MRALLMICLLAAPAVAQPPKLGLFTNSGDIGAPPIQGSAAFDPATGEYRITGSGTDIWGRADQFHYVWREMTGDFAVTASARFLTEGHAHRKAVIMLRGGVETDAPFVQLAIHGDGTPGVQFRKAKGDYTHTVDFLKEGRGTWKLKLLRRGGTITVWIAKDGAPLKELGHSPNQPSGPVLLGLGVSSHTQAAVNTVLFSDVTVEQLERRPAAPAPTRQDLGLFTHSGDVGAPDRKGSATFDAATGEYRITGAGANIWGRQDQFQYVWKELTGNFALSASLRFLGQGNPHRKAGIMLRQSLESDSAYADTVIHGDGMAAIQWRGTRGDDTNAFDFPIEAPGTFRIKMVRNGVRIYLYLASEGAELAEIAHTEVTFRGPVLIGLAVCSHDAAASDTAVFSQVSLEELAPAPARQP